MPENTLPDIVFITTDTQGREMLSCYVDRPCVETPHLDRLAQEGVRFENAFTTCPLCTPARSSWYTGLYPNRSGAWANGQSPHSHVPMLGDVLRSAGYETKHLGKWHLDAIGYYETGHADGGFDVDNWYDLGAFLDDVGREGPNRFGGWNKGFEDETFCFAHRVADRAIDILKKDRDQPLFLAVEFDEPHGPYICPPPFRGQYAYEDLYRPPSLNADMQGKPKLQQDYSQFMRAGRDQPDGLAPYYKHYYDCNAYVDYEIGRVLDAVRSFSEDAVVIFTSDHGDHLGAFGLGAKGPTMYDHTTAVPLIVRAPNVKSRVVDSVVSSVDVWATILGYAGIDCSGFSRGNGYTGQSLIPVLQGDEHAVRDHVVVEYNRFGIAQSQCDGLYPIRSVRTQDWKLNVNLLDCDELYDLNEDPNECHNVIDDPRHRSIRDDLHDYLLKWQAQTKDPFRGPVWQTRPWRAGVTHSFEGLFTTGYKDVWEHDHFQ